MISSHKVVVARQSVAVGAGHCDDGLREIFILHQACITWQLVMYQSVQNLSAYLESCSPQVSSSSRLCVRGGGGGGTVCSMTVELIRNIILCALWGWGQGVGMHA